MEQKQHPLSAPTGKKLRSCHTCPYEKKKLDKLKINDFSQNQERTEFAGLPPHNLHTQAHSETHPRSAYLKQKLLGQLIGTLKW